MLTVLTTQLGSDGTRGTVTIESNGISLPSQVDELLSTEARTLVLTAVIAAGIKGSPGISRMASSPFPVNSAGEPIEELRDAEGQLLPMTHPRCQPHHFRAAYEVTARP